MKKLLLAATILASLTGQVLAADSIKVGVILGYTGPIESLTPDMAASAELAMKEISDSGIFLGGMEMESIRADSTCVDSAAATANAEKLITADGVAAIMGADCSGVTGAIANNVAVPNGVVMVSPSATSPGLSQLEDKGYFFRTAPSDARQGEVIADILMSRGIKDIAVTYTNNDYGKGLSDSFGSAFAAAGGSVSMVAAHEDGKADYSAEVGALAASGSKHLAVFGYIDQGGKGMIQASLDTGAFEVFMMADGMFGESLLEAFGTDLNGSIATVPGAETAGASTFSAMAEKAGITVGGPFTGESYDAAALIALSMQAAKSSDRAAVQSKMMDVANAPGELINPGELEKGLRILAAGGEIDYVGATGVEFNDLGEVLGSYKEMEVKAGKYETVMVR
ncbi:MAG: ABC transporter substrate-binding protein [Rhodospirillales bacterium]|jgi:branched-chain amino acid transport system substrate-binding protein|nr:ABC transporter substrate-binding protein [Rhodospirillales bacterium]